MREIDCEDEKKRFLKAYKCYDGNAMDSLAEVIHIIPTHDFPAYDETPKNAVIFARTGMDGCHYCMVKDDDKMNIYYVEPNDRVFLIGNSISDILSYGLAIAPSLFSEIFDLEKDAFLQMVDDAKQEWELELNSKRFKNDLKSLNKVFHITEISASEVYDRLRAMNPTK
jgi:hypothetical protein